MNKIPEEMLEAATKGVLTQEGHKDIDDDFLIDFPNCARIAREKAQAALEAADVPGLLARIAELENELQSLQRWRENEAEWEQIRWHLMTPQPVLPHP